MGESLKELNEAVYTAGIESLSNAALPRAKASDDEAPADPEAEKRRPSMPPN